MANKARLPTYVTAVLRNLKSSETLIKRHAPKIKQTSVLLKLVVKSCSDYVQFME